MTEYKSEDQVFEETMQEMLDETGISSVISVVASNSENMLDTLKLKGNQISNLSDSDLTSRIYNLGQYLVYIQSYHNQLTIDAFRAKCKFDLQLAMARSKITAKTEKEKEAIALQTDIGLQDLYTLKNETEAKAMLFDKIPDSIIEISNALKKELSLRPQHVRK